MYFSGEDVDEGGGHAFGDVGVHGKSLYLPLNENCSLKMSLLKNVVIFKSWWPALYPK